MAAAAAAAAVVVVVYWRWLPSATGSGVGEVPIESAVAVLHPCKQFPHGLLSTGFVGSAQSFRFLGILEDSKPGAGPLFCMELPTRGDPSFQRDLCGANSLNS